MIESSSSFLPNDEKGYRMTVLFVEPTGSCSFQSIGAISAATIRTLLQLIEDESYEQNMYKTHFLTGCGQYGSLCGKLISRTVGAP